MDSSEIMSVRGYTPYDLIRPCVKAQEATEMIARLKRGHKSNRVWDVYSDVATQGTTLVETNTMPETNFTVTQGTMTITEGGKLLAPLLSSFMKKTIENSVNCWKLLKACQTTAWLVTASATV